MQYNFSLKFIDLAEPLREATGSIEIRTQSRVTTAPEADQSDGTSVTTIVSAVFGGIIIGVLVTVIVYVCVWCITGHIRTQVSYSKGGQTSSDNRKQQHQHQQPDGSSNAISMQRNEAYKQIQLTGCMERTVCHTATDAPEQAVRLNRSGRCIGMET